jgi:hypothetical protein
MAHLQNVFVDCGMDHVFNDMLTNANKWVSNFNYILEDNNNRNWLNNVRSKSSLLNYVLFKTKPYLEDYLLCNNDFYAASLKFKARSNTLSLNGRTHLWNKNGNSICPLCKNGTEDLKHFLFVCNTLKDIRAAEYLSLEHQLNNNDLNSIWCLFIASDLNIKTCLILGLSKDYFLNMRSIDIDCMCNIFDSVCKSFLKRAWNLRNEHIK